MSKKPTGPGYYWATGPEWLAEPDRQIVRVARNTLPDSTLPGEWLVYCVNDVAAYRVADFTGWSGLIQD